MSLVLNEGAYFFSRKYFSKTILGRFCYISYFLISGLLLFDQFTVGFNIWRLRLFGQSHKAFLTGILLQKRSPIFTFIHGIVDSTIELASYDRLTHHGPLYKHILTLLLYKTLLRRLVFFHLRLIDDIGSVYGPPLLHEILLPRLLCDRSSDKG